MKYRVVNLAGVIVVILGSVLSLYTQFRPNPRIFVWIVLTISLLYLCGGWILFKKYIPDGHPFLLFVMGYLYSGVFMAAVFSSYKWPLYEMFSVMAILFALLQILLVYLKRTIILKYSLVQLFFEGIIIFILSIILTVNCLIHR
jgi:hypothetical protein